MTADFEPGSRLGPYELADKLGEGGMGQVYRARDTRLNRTVAIKVLSRAHVADPERKRRLLSEARAAAALNHPHINTLHDIACQDGVDYLVLEYVPGQPLSKMLRAGGLPPSEALTYAEQIACALAAAHAAGMVHRDIKPANVMVNPEGQIKVLDFGLAKLAECPGPEGETRTESSALTGSGVLAGTISYMSPEQASGRELDHRTDIFSAGIVLYEMLVGCRPFRGASSVETLHAILHDPVPPLGSFPEGEDILAKALAKDPKDRYQHAGDFALDLRRLAGSWKQKRNRAVPATLPPRRGIAWFGGIALALLAGVGGGWYFRTPTAVFENPLASARFSRLTDFEGAEADAALSPDGKFAVFMCARDGPFDVWMTQVGSGRFTNLTKGVFVSNRFPVRTVGFSGDGSEIWLRGPPDSRMRVMSFMGGPTRPFLGDRAVNVAWSPDGKRIVYHTNEPGDPTWVADATGGAPRLLAGELVDGMHQHFHTWSLDGRWIYYVRGIQNTTELDLWRIPASGGKPEQLTHHNTEVGYPTVIDARTLLYIAREPDGSGPWLWAIDLERKATRRVTLGLEQYLSVAASADGRRLVATVANPTASLWSVPILDRVAEDRDVKPFPVSTVRALTPRFGGTGLFYLSSRGTGDGLWRFQDGQALEVWNGGHGGLFEPPAVSADGRRVALILRRNGKRRLHVVTADGAEVQPLAESFDVQGTAAWSPDGRWIAACGNDGSGPGLFKIPTSGGAPVRLRADTLTNPVWSPNGKLIVYEGPASSGKSPLLAMRPDGTRVELPEIRVQVQGERARFVPDGRALVYMLGPFHDFWWLDLATQKTRRLTSFRSTDAVRTFDITPDGKHIVFDRLRDNSDVVLIDLPR